MSYRVLGPEPIPFASGLAPDDPARDPANLSWFFGYDDPHVAVAWLLVAVPTLELNPEEFVLRRGVWERQAWSNEHLHRSGLSERAVVEGMVSTLRQGGDLRPVITHANGGQVRLIDGYHRLAAHLTAGVAETACYLLVPRS